MCFVMLQAWLVSNDYIGPFSKLTPINARIIILLLAKYDVMSLVYAGCEAPHSLTSELYSCHCM